MGLIPRKRLQSGAGPVSVDSDAPHGHKQGEMSRSLSASQHAPLTMLPSFKARRSRLRVWASFYSSAVNNDS
ncbi:hypothetical protein HMPREF9004_0938 [Schaalia cardiffensis F0333]|uniref:Uncharacterized protein n=1 Tax=Schaalia cardiffensis F0333 TaxID=888050 RepID=N6WDR4_9ACTO|nr:hypothetical protein HMPREF9004_0938 [Schaalia cardiffensis F0333]